MNNENYTQSVLEKVVNKYLDQKIPASDIGLNSLIEQTDHIVWEIATYIYKESGQQLDFSLIRSLIDVRIEYLKGLFAEEKRLEEEKRILEDKILAEERRIAEEKRLSEETSLVWKNSVQELKKLGKDTDKLTPILFKVKNVIASILSLDIDAIELNSSVECDDLDLIELLMAIEEEFNIEIPDHHGDKFATVGDIFNYVAEQVL